MALIFFSKYLKISNLIQQLFFALFCDKDNKFHPFKQIL